MLWHSRMGTNPSKEHKHTNTYTHEHRHTHIVAHLQKNKTKHYFNNKLELDTGD